MSVGDTVMVTSNASKLSRAQASYAGQTGTVVAIGVTMARIEFNNGKQVNFEFALLR